MASKTNSKTNRTVKLGETQLVLLSAASQRRDGLVVKREGMADRSFDRSMRGLLKHGLIHTTAERPARSRKADFAGDGPWFLITPAGLDAIGVADEEQIGFVAPEEIAPDPEASVAPSRRGTKRALVIALLSRQDGATLNDLIAATGWLPHTTRAALTGLRHKGFRIERQRSEEGVTVYRIAGRAESAADQAEAA